MLYLLFFASGAAGLIYEVCWVREFGNVFGNTVYSASLVTAVFMCGLGAGSLGAGGWADRRRGRAGAQAGLLRAYGAAELGVALFGIALAWSLPRLGGVSASLSAYTRDAAGWYELSWPASALRYAAAALVLCPPALLMGSTLTLLSRATVASGVDDAGWRIGALYAVNTAGAALGAVAVDAVLVPRAGIFRTELCAVGANILAALGAVLLSRRSDPQGGRVEDKSAPSVAPAPAVERRPLIAGCAALALSGFSAMGLEIVWFRFLSSTRGGYRFVFSLVLSVILCGLWLGALVGGAAHRRWRRPIELFALSQTLVAVSSLLLLMHFQPQPRGYAGTLVAVAAVVALPSLFMGASFPLVNAQVQDALEAVGRRVGWLYLANTLGGVAGSLVAGLVLTPWVGSQVSFLTFATSAALAPLALATGSPLTSARRRLLGAGMAASLAAAAAFSLVPARALMLRFFSLPDEAKVLDLREGPNETVAVLSLAKGRSLFVNGRPMSGTSLGAQRYMRAFVHVPLLMSERPERALVICFGVGNTVHAASLHRSLSRIEVADLSRNVLEHAHWFAAANHDVIADPRVAVFVADGRQHLRQSPPEAYDLITLEPPPIAFAGVSALYSREFYQLARSRLKKGGYLTQWLPAYQTTPRVALEMARAFVDAFPNAALLSGQWSELILLGTTGDTLGFDLDRIEANLAQNPAVAEDLRRVSLGSPTEIVGTFLADGDGLRAMTAGVPPISDDRPAMEYVYDADFEAPAAFFTRTEDLPRFCPSCFAGAKPDPRVRWLPEYLAALRLVYADPGSRRSFARLRLPAPPALSDAIARSPYLSAIFGSGGVGVERQAARALFMRAFSLARAGSLAEAARAYEQGLALDPHDDDARYNLAAIYASTGREDDAVAEASRVLQDDASYLKAKQMLCALRPDSCR